jgi:hypothetical protein
MNGRIYDPLTGLFLSTDNYIQNPDFTQSFNRYSYCLNNPLKYSDPTGEKLKWWQWLAGDILTGGFFTGTSSGILATLPSVQITANALDFTSVYFKGFSDPGVAGESFDNALRIEFGGFTGSFKQILSRWTWELPQTIIGNTYSHFINFTGKVDNVNYYDGATVLKCYGDGVPMGDGAIGVTLGSYIIGNNEIVADPINWLFQHEYGHYLQSQAVGPAYLSAYALPSVYGDSGYGHDYNPVEQDANVRAIQYFYNKSGSSFKWDFKHNSIGNPGNSWTMSDYNTPEFQSLLKSLKISPKWYDYAGWAFNLYSVFYAGNRHASYYKNNPVQP